MNTTTTNGHVAPQPNDTPPLPQTAHYEDEDERERTSDDDGGLKT
jgi:hypothetical protein